MEFSIKSRHGLWRHVLIIYNNKKDVLNMARRTYSQEFKEYVSKLVVQDGRKLVDICQELDIPYHTLQKWTADYKKKQQAAEQSKQSQLLTASEYKELYEAERRKKLELEEEVAILKKAMHIFTIEKN
jgi:transposase